MKVLLDSCVSGHAVAAVRDAGHDVVWTGDWPSDPGDQQILRFAADQSRVMVTIDKDFGELAIVQGMVHVALIRLVGFRAAEQGAAVVRLLATYEGELSAGAILTAEPWRVRVRLG
jgi:predicted nuclease of predicted toxin-antitoxin system